MYMPPVVNIFHVGENHGCNAKILSASNRAQNMQLLLILVISEHSSYRHMHVCGRGFRVSGIKQQWLTTSHEPVHVKWWVS